MCLFSVIMPVYNASIYLDGAVNSVLDQTYKNFELILVDDGSTDGSCEKCDAYAQRDKRVKVIHIENSGISKARNIGMKMAEGKYIAFCDHDDEYSNVLMEKVKEYIDAYNAPNVLKYTAKQIKIWSDNFVSMNSLPEKEMQTAELVKDYNLLMKFERFIWDGIYKRDFIERNILYFDEAITKGGEDFAFNIELFGKVDRIISIKECLYTHFYRVGQSTSTKFAECNHQVYIKNAEKEYALIKSFSDKNEMFLYAMIMHKARYTVAIASDCIYKTGCNLNRKEILNRIEEIRALSAYIYKDSLRAFFYLFKKNLKWGILYGAFSLKQVWLMYLIMRCNQMVRYKKQ